MKINRQRAAPASLFLAITMPLAGLSGLVLPTSATAAVINGSFEAGPSDNLDHVHRGSPAPDGWSILSGYDLPDIVSNGYAQGGPPFMVLLGAQQGNRFLDMNGAGPQGGLFQDLVGYTAGQTVTMTYYTSRWAQNSAGTLSASLIDPTTMTVLNTDLTVVAFDNTVTSSAWQQKTLSAIVPLSGSLRIQFIGDSGASDRAALGLDNVSVTGGLAAVPLPASAPMLGAALIGLAGLGFGLKRKQAAAPA